jgi:8-oxo-dGTP diphosphatase
MSKMLQFPQSKPDYHVALSLSLVILGFNGKKIEVLIAKSKNPDYEGQLFLPSRNLITNDDFNDVATTMFKNLFGYTPRVLEQLKAFGKVSRARGGRVVNIAHYALVKTSAFKSEEWSDYGIHWCPVENVPELAFEHNEIIEYARERLARRVRRRPVGFEMLPPEFTIGQLIKLYERALQKNIDKRNFRKKVFKTNLLEDLDKKATGKLFGAQKGSQLYRFNISSYEQMKDKEYPFKF